MRSIDANPQFSLEALTKGNLALAILQQRIDSANSNPQIIKEHATAASFLRTPIYQAEAVKKIVPGLTYRQLNSWESNGLIELERTGSERGWRKISPYDLIQLLIISQLRFFGFSLKDIKVALKFLRLPFYYEGERFVDSISLGMLEAVIFGFPSKLVVTIDKIAAIVRDELFYTMLSFPNECQRPFILIDYSQLVSLILTSRTEITRPFLVSTYDKAIFQIAHEASMADFTQLKVVRDSKGFKQIEKLQNLSAKDLSLLLPDKKQSSSTIQSSERDSLETELRALIPRFGRLTIHSKGGNSVRYEIERILKLRR